MKFEELFNVNNALPYLTYKRMKILFSHKLLSRQLQSWMVVNDYLVPVHLTIEDYQSDEWGIPTDENRT